MSNPIVTRAVTLGVADFGRQSVMKGDVKVSKSVAVAGSSLFYQYLLAKPVQMALVNWNQSDLGYAWDLLVEVLGVATTLMIFEKMGVVSKSDAKVEGDKKGKRGEFMKALYLSAIDVGVAEIILSLMGPSIMLGQDPTATTAPVVSSGAVASKSTTYATKTYVK